MPPNKNQHFVPQFYLRLFSNNKDQKTVGIWNIERELFIPSGGIKGQASLDYFYGKDLEVETAFKQMETAMRPVFSYLIETKHLFKPLSQEHFEFLFFVLLTNGRTKFAADRIDEMIDKFAKAIFKHDPNVKDYLNEFEIKSSNAVIEALDKAIYQVPLALDLQFKMVVNGSTIPFVLSDHPIVFHNQFLMDRRWPGGHTGIAQWGLQILVPLSPRCMIIFYDGKVYKVGNRKEDIVLTSEDSDINQINQMQFLNAGENLYFNEKIDESYCIQLSRKAKKLRNKNKVKFSEFKSLDDPRGFNTLLGISDPGLKMDLRLSCMKNLKKSKKIKIGPSMYNVRDPRAVEEHRKRMDEIEKEREDFLEKDQG